MKIHGLVYLIIGIFITGFSYFVGTVNKNGMQKFYLFILVGIIFFLIGFFKLIGDYISKRNNRKELANEPVRQNQSYYQNNNYQENQRPHNPNHMAQNRQYNQQHSMHQHQMQGHQVNHQHHQVHHPQHSQHTAHQSHQAYANQQRNPNVKYCARCNTPHRHFDRYCYRCGNRSFRQ